MKGSFFMKKIAVIMMSVYVLLLSNVNAEVMIHKKDATVWGQEQLIKGKLVDMFVDQGVLYVNGTVFPFQIQARDSSFAVPIDICEGENLIYVEVDSSDITIASEMLLLKLGYKLRPEVFAYARVTGNDVQLQSQVIDNPGDHMLAYSWQVDHGNPSELELTAPNETATQIVVPPDAVNGEYYFDLIVVASDGDSTKARTFITVDASGMHPFDIRTDHAEWIDRAVLYEITPCDFVDHGKLNDITDKIPELADFGVSAIWLQPIFGTPDFDGMGYGITDYFSVRDDVGSESDLHRLVKTAHEHDLKVLLDIVPNHTFIHHPYAVDLREHGTSSHYYDYYQHDAEFDPAVPYSQYYNMDDDGFVNYFWDQLPNLNYDNPEVRRWMTEICRYWIEEFDIDGYRFDAVWGVTARRPDYTKELRLALKRIKPEILMLAEDKASWPSVFDERFDVGFDWTASEDWVSQWSWQVSYNDYWQDNNATIFNTWQQGRSHRLRMALTNDGNGYHPRAKILRFMGNNDIPHFIRHHGPERTKMTAALMFALNGVPLIFNGQEIGYSGPHPYFGHPIFKRGRSIESLDSEGLFPFYKKLIQLRKSYPALTDDNFKELPVEPNYYVYAFHRWSDSQDIVTVINMGDREVAVSLTLPVNELALDSLTMYYLTDLISGDVLSGLPEELCTVNFSIESYSTRIYLLADTLTKVAVELIAMQNISKSFDLLQNYPNPFNPSTTIAYEVPEELRVTLTVYNVLGEQVAVLVDETKSAGNYRINFTADNLPSGLYLYNLKIGSKSITRKMVLSK